VINIWESAWRGNEWENPARIVMGHQEHGITDFYVYAERVNADLELKLENIYLTDNYNEALAKYISLATDLYENHQELSSTDYVLEKLGLRSPFDRSSVSLCLNSKNIVIGQKWPEEEP
jgi:hypothetical protein